MKGKYKAALALLLALSLLLLSMVFTVAHWLPSLAGIWLPQGTRIAMEASPRLRHGAIVIPDLRYLAGECELASVKDARLSHPGRWRLHLTKLNINPDCIGKIPAKGVTSAAPRTVEEWQQMLPNTWLTIDQLNVTPWLQYAGALHLSLTPQVQQLDYQGKLLTLSASLTGQNLKISDLKIGVFEGLAPLELVGNLTLPLVPDGLPTDGQVSTQARIPQVPDRLDVALNWHANAGSLTVKKQSVDEPPLLSLPWRLSEGALEIDAGQWRWPYDGFPVDGGISLKVDNWQAGLDNAIFTGRLNVLTQGEAGKGNAVLNIGPGKLSLTDSALPLQLTGEAKQDQLIFYAVLPGELTGALTDPTLLFHPGALLRSRGRLIKTLNIDDVRWPLAGVRVSRKGIDGRLQAILRAHDNEMGALELHLDGKARDFLPDAGLWQWRYWGKGRFTPMQAKWDVRGVGEWRDSAIELNSLSTGFDKLQYGSMRMSKPRLRLDNPLRWERNQQKEVFTGDFSLNAGATSFSGGSTLPASTLKFSVDGQNPTSFLFKGDLHAGKIGPVRVVGRWDGVRLRGNAWWPKQTLTVFQPLLPADWKMDLKGGELYAQVAFSAAAGQGFEAGGHGVVKNGSLWMPDNQINGVDFVLPFRFSDSTWHLGTRGPVTLRIAEVRNQIAAKNITADLQGDYPWSEQRPLLLTNVNADVLGGKITMQQLRMPQHDAALLRLQGLSSSELVSAINPKQFAMSGRFNGSLPLWLNHPQWIIKDGWLNNPGAMTFRMDKEMADAIVENNMAAGAAINWLRYMEISRSWTNINLDNLGVIRMRASVTGISHVDGKTNTVNLNYTHEENLFTLWRSLRFGDNLQTWLEENAALPTARCIQPGKVCEEPK